MALRHRRSRVQAMMYVTTLLVVVLAALSSVRIYTSRRRSNWNRRVDSICDALEQTPPYNGW